MDINKEIKDAGADFEGLEPLKDTPVAPAHGIAAIALNMAMKYHDICTVKDGAMYQQYKLEGKNLREINIDNVFETAIKIDIDVLETAVEDEPKPETDAKSE